MAIPTAAQFVKLYGLGEATRQMRELPKAARENYAIAAEQTAKLIVMRARAKVPRRPPITGYSGGALQQRIGYAVNRSSGDAVVGIEKGLIVITRAGRQVWVRTERKRTLERVSTKGKRKGQIVKTTYRSLLGNHERAEVRFAGGRIVQPTKYGHFSEFGRGGRRGTAASHPWLVPAVLQSVEYFTDQMRWAARETETNLAAEGFKG